MSAAARDLYLPAGHFHFGGGDLRIHTLLGTCVAIVVWHPHRRIGGICHYLLPARRPGGAVEADAPGMYAEDVMGLFLGALRNSGTLPGEYVVKVAGGGNMFPDQAANGECRKGLCNETVRAGCHSVGCKNINVARMLLATNGFAITSENVGGQGSRQVIFELRTGDVWVKRGAPMALGPKVAA